MQNNDPEHTDRANEITLVNTINQSLDLNPVEQQLLIELLTTFYSTRSKVWCFSQVLF